MHIKLLVLSCALFLLAPANTPASAADVPRTGQTRCYGPSGAEISCTGTGQDGDLQAGKGWPSPRFTDNNNSTVTDNLTGLIWMKNAGTPSYFIGPQPMVQAFEPMPSKHASGLAYSCLGGPKTWLQALDYVTCLNSNNYLGHNDWQLPNTIELESLVDISASSPALPTGHPFTNVLTDSYYWSSTTSYYNTGEANIVLMSDGALIAGAAKSTATPGISGVNTYVWPVRSGATAGTIELPKTGQTASYASGDDGALQKGAATPTPRFSDNNNGTITDNLTGLIWLKNADCFGLKSWSDALSAANGLASGSCGLTDGSAAGQWRLANRSELMSLIDRGMDYPALPSGHLFTGVQSDIYWTSSSYSPDTGIAWGIHMYHGDIYTGTNYTKASNTHYMWPVRSVQADNPGGGGDGGGGGTPLTSYTLTITKNGTGSGNVNASGGTLIWAGDTVTALYSSDSTLLLYATADEGSVFTGWSGDCSGTGACALTMNSNKNVIATFDASNTLTVSKSGNGTGTVTSNAGDIDCGATCADGYDLNTVVILTAIPDTDSNFTGWLGCGIPVGPICIVVMTAAQNITAVFDMPTLTVVKSGNGTGAVTSDIDGINCGETCSASYGVGTTVTLTASPDEGSTFTGWAGSGCTGNGSCAVTINADTVVNANFAKQNTICTYSISSQNKSFKAVGGTGIVRVTTQTGCSWAAASNVSWITITSDQSGDGKGTLNYIVAMNTGTSPRTGRIVIGDLTLTITQSPAASPKITVIPPSVDLGNIEANLKSIKTIIIKNSGSAPLSIFNINLSDTGNAFSIIEDGCSGKTLQKIRSCTVKVQFSPKAEGTFSGTITILSNDPDFSIKNVSLTGKCKGRIWYRLTVNRIGSGKGSVSVSPKGKTCGPNVQCFSASLSTPVTLTAKGSSGSTFTNWSDSCSGTESSCSLVMDDDKTASAEFTKTCVYTYSAWSACQSDSTKTRTVLSSKPEGCVGTPVLSQSCTYTPPSGGDSAFKGTITGKWSGTCDSYSVNGSFTMTIASNGAVTGSYSGSGSGPINGTVNTSGNFSAGGSAGGAGWSGHFSVSGTTLSGSGSWSLSGCSGTSWSGSGTASSGSGCQSCQSGYPLYCPTDGKCYKVAGSSPCGLVGEVICGQ